MSTTTDDRKTVAVRLTNAEYEELRRRAYEDHRSQQSLLAEAIGQFFAKPKDESLRWLRAARQDSTE
jgi:uncharacterized iron-regulated protein